MVELLFINFDPVRNPPRIPSPRVNVDAKEPPAGHGNGNGSTTNGNGSNDNDEQMIATHLLGQLNERRDRYNQLMNSIQTILASNMSYRNNSAATASAAATSTNGQIANGLLVIDNMYQHLVSHYPATYPDPSSTLAAILSSLHAAQTQTPSHGHGAAAAANHDNNNAATSIDNNGNGSVAAVVTAIPSPSPSPPNIVKLATPAAPTPTAASPSAPSPP
jgi:hypothetical protein